MQEKLGKVLGHASATLPVGPGSLNRQVARAFRELYSSHRTGVLVCEGPESKRNVYLDAGFIVGARSSVKADRLGEVMIRHGLITRQHFDDASHFIKGGYRIGEILTELGVVTPEDVHRALRIQVLDIACPLIIKPPPKVSFTNLEDIETTVHQPIPVADILMETARRTPHIRRFVEELTQDRRPLQFNSDPKFRSQEVELASHEGFILSRIDGMESAHDIFAVSPLSEEQTARVLLGLLEAGILVPGAQPASTAEKIGVGPNLASDRTSEGIPKAVTDPPKSRAAVEPREQMLRQEVEEMFARCQRQDHWEVLGLVRGASPEDVARAFRERTKTYHPDRFHSISDRDFQDKVSFVFSRLTEAHETLTVEKQASQYDELAKRDEQYEKQNEEWAARPSDDRSGTSPPVQESRTKDDAKALFARAKNAYAKCDYWTTIQCCREAIEILSDQPEYYHLLGLALQENPKWRQDAEKNFRIAIKLDSWRPEHLISLAELYRKAGMKTRASRTYEQARALDPSLEIPKMD